MAYRLIVTNITRTVINITIHHNADPRTKQLAQGLQITRRDKWQNNIIDQKIKTSHIAYHTMIQ